MSSIRTAKKAAGSLRCPSCRSDNVRRSGHHRGGALRRLLLSDYRCRECNTCFSRLDVGIFVLAGAAVLIVVMGFVGGWALREYHEPDEPIAPESAAEPTAAEPPSEGLLGSTRSAATGPGGEPAIAPPDASSLMLPSGSQGLGGLAESGQARAQFSLGMSYLNGTGGIAKDLALAFKWFEKSAQQGYVEAQYALGSMYLAGRGALQSFDLAYEWFDKAAQQNHAEAQYRLGILFRSGHGVPIDKTKAYFWFNLAAAQGHERAAEARDSLLTTLNPEQIARAQREAQAWKPAPPKQ